MKVLFLVLLIIFDEFYTNVGVVKYELRMANRGPSRFLCGYSCTTLQSLFESLKSLGTEPFFVVLTSRPMVVLVMILEHEENYYIDNFNYA